MSRYLLAYRAREGVLETHLTDAPGGPDLQSFVRRAVDLGREAPTPTSFRLLDSFLSDTLEVSTLIYLIANRPPAGVKFCLANPRSRYALARAGAIGEEVSVTRFVRGLRKICKAIVDVVEASVPNVEELQEHDLLRLISTLGAECGVDFRTYEIVPSGPLWFFSDILLMGRFSPARSSLYMPWTMVVDDPHFQHDLYSKLSEEFDTVWQGSSGILDSRRPNQQYRVFVSYSRDDRDLAIELQQSLEAKGISVFRDEQVRAGEKWSDELARELRECDELLAILTDASKTSVWVHAELGAAWALGKRITPALAGLRRTELPLTVPNWNAVAVVTEAGKKKLIEAIVSRFHGQG